MGSIFLDTMTISIFTLLTVGVAICAIALPFVVLYFLIKAAVKRGIIEAHATMLQEEKEAEAFERSGKIKSEWKAEYFTPETSDVDGDPGEAVDSEDNDKGE